MGRLRVERVCSCIAAATGLVISPTFASDRYFPDTENCHATYVMDISPLTTTPVGRRCDAETFRLKESLVSELVWSTSVTKWCGLSVDVMQLAAAAEPIDSLAAPTPPNYVDVWARIRAGFGIARITGPRVTKYRTWYTKHPKHITRVLERSQRYLYFIVEELEKRNMPTEIALLPVIESAYNPRAQSRMRAAGLWQFIPSTGRQY